jgi:hypothetical protein
MEGTVERWDAFVRLFINILKSRSMYPKETSILRDSKEISFTDFDSFFVYKMIIDDGDLTSKVLATNLLKTVDSTKAKESHVQTLAYWLQSDKFKQLVVGLMGSDEDLLDAKQIDNLFNEIEYELNNDTFMDSLFSILIPYSDKGGSIASTFKNDLTLLQLHQKRNIYWLWFLSVAFFFINNIFVILKDGKVLKKQLFGPLKQKQLQENSFFDAYPILFITLTLRFMLSGKLPSARDSFNGTVLFNDDISHLFYIIFDPYDERQEPGDVAFQRIAMGNIVKSKLLSLKKHYNEQEEVNSRAFFDQLMQTRKTKTTTGGLQTVYTLEDGDYYELEL